MPGLQLHEQQGSLCGSYWAFRPPRYGRALHISVLCRHWHPAHWIRKTPMLRKVFPSTMHLSTSPGPVSISWWVSATWSNFGVSGTCTALQKPSQQRQSYNHISAQAPAGWSNPYSNSSHHCPFLTWLLLLPLCSRRNHVLSTQLHQSRVSAKAFLYWQLKLSQLGLGISHHGHGSSGRAIRAIQSVRTFTCLKIKQVNNKHLQQWSLFEQAAWEQRL